MWHLMDGETGEILFSHKDESRVLNLGLLMKKLAPNRNIWAIWN